MTMHGSWTLDALLEEYEQHQRRTRGLKASSLRVYGDFVRLLLRAVLGEDPIDVTRIGPADVIRFTASVRGRFCPRTMKTLATALRSFFRYLRAEGLCDARLEAAVPAVAHWRLSDLPRALTDEQLDRLLASLGTSPPCGRRDRAMVLCLASLGMRPGELAELCLDDIDWRQGTLQIRTRKTRRGAVLPLPREAGRAIVDYLREERPDTRERRVFVQHGGSRRGAPISGHLVSGAVASALDRAGVHAPIAGAYVLRHTVASRMVRHGTSLKEVADFLGHRDLDTTAIYAKLDLPALCDVAMPWPEVTP